MTPTDDLRLTLRMNLDEVIPPDGTDADTMFSNAEIDNLLSQSQTIEEASWRGWVLKGMRVAMSAVGGLETAQMGSENFRWASASDFLDLAKQMAGYWWDQIPTGMTPDVGGTGIILSIAPVPMPGINVPVGDMGDQWSTSGTVWWPGDLSRLQTYIKHGWQWPSAETYQATIPQ